MSLTATSTSVPVPFSVHKTDDWGPELLLLRFIGDECVERRVGSLWRPLFDSDYDLNFNQPQFLPPETIQCFLAITHRMSAREVQIQKVHLADGRHRRLVEVQLTAYPPDESVILLRDISQVARLAIHYTDAAPLVALLSPWEFEVLRLVVHGEPNKTVAARLNISAKPVEKHRTSILRKTGTRNSAELIRRTYPVFNDSEEL